MSNAQTSWHGARKLAARKKRFVARPARQANVIRGHTKAGRAPFTGRHAQRLPRFDEGSSVVWPSLLAALLAVPLPVRDLFRKWAVQSAL